MKQSCRTSQYDQPQGLMIKTLKLLSERNLAVVSAETRISFYWLKKFLSGAYKNPSVNRVQSLYEYLTGSNLI